MSRVQLESKKYNNIESFEKEFGHSYPTCRLHVKDSFLKKKYFKKNQQKKRDLLFVPPGFLFHPLK
jgi:hypothetical protein